MSLINEALKKAQRQRAGDTPSLSSLPSVGGQTPSQIAKRNTPGFNTLLLRVGLGAGALAILIVGGIVVFRHKETAPPAPVSAAATPAPAPSAAIAPAPAPVVANPTATVAPPTPAPARASTPAPVQVAAQPAPAPAPASTFVVPNVTSSAPAAAVKAEPVAPKPEPVQIAAAPVAPHAAPVVEAPRPEPVRTSAPLKLEPRAINFIEGIRVAGIRASSTDSKVLMNDRVYRVGDTVEHEMGLRLVAITSSSLTFEDDRGAKYTRSF